MRHAPLACSLAAAIVVCAGALPALAGVSETYVADPLYEAGGYWELAVTNDSAEPMYVLALGNVGSTVVFTEPALVGQWLPDYWSAASWDEGLSFSGAAFTPPDTRTLPFATTFPGDEQVLLYYVLPAGTPIAPGQTRGGFRFLSPIGGSPFVLFGGDGNVVEQGETTGPTPAASTTWGAIKSLYR